MTKANIHPWGGDAFLTIANGVDPDRRSDYEAWHSLEHVPERLTMPGFLSAMRLVEGHGAETRYLTIYDLETAAAVETPAYRHLLANPTPGSLAMRPVMTDFRRGLYRQDGCSGAGAAGHLGWVTWRGLPIPGSLDLAGRDGIASVRLGTSLPLPSHPAFPSTSGQVEEHRIVLISGTTIDELRPAIAHVSAIAAVKQGIMEYGLADLILAY